VLSPGTAALAATGTVAGALDTIDRDQVEWFNAVVVTYRWTDAADVAQVQWDVAGDLASSRVLHVEHERPGRGPGRPPPGCARPPGTGGSWTWTPWRTRLVYPGQAATLSVPGTPTQTGYVQAVEWTLPADTMHVTTRDLVDTPSTAWLLGQAGQSWTDVPAGMTWAPSTGQGWRRNGQRRQSRSGGPGGVRGVPGRPAGL
jgi:hypothetical protein